jgi:hypothetical protein
MDLYVFWDGVTYVLVIFDLFLEILWTCVRRDVISHSSVGDILAIDFDLYVLILMICFLFREK